MCPPGHRAVATRSPQVASEERGQCGGRAWGRAGFWSKLPALQEGPVALCIQPRPPARSPGLLQGFDAPTGQVGGTAAFFCLISVPCFVITVLGWVAVLGLYQRGINAGLVLGLCVPNNGLDRVGRGNT